AQTQLIDDLLDMSRIMSGKMRLDMQPLEVRAVARCALDPVAPAAEVKSIALAAALDGVPVRVLGDSDRLQQVMWNLLSNAIKFTPKGGRVDVRVRVANGDAEISVGDTGAGISPEFLPHVFDRFRQADSTSTRSHGGLGLGLAIVRHLVDLHGGTVHAESAGTGRGATFVVSLPLRELHEEPAAATVTLARPRALTAGFQAHVTKPVEPRAFLEVLAGLRAAHPRPAGTPAAPTDRAAPRRGSA